MEVELDVVTLSAGELALREADAAPHQTDEKQWDHCRTAANGQFETARVNA